MAFITLANTNKIIFNSNIKELDLSGEVYKIPIHFFSKYENNSLLAVEELLKDPEKYFNEIYIPYKPVDTYKFIYEGKHPSYHKIPTCPMLSSTYENFEIPEQIQERGKDEVLEFRRWFESVKYLLEEERPDVFVMRLQARWGIQTNPKAISRVNSGTTEIEINTIEELENQIDMKIKEAGRFYYMNEKNKIILKRFSKYTFIAYKGDPIYNNDTPYSDEEIRDLLKDYDNRFKRPIKKMLIEYYRLKHNPDIKMEGEILEQLGFKPCGHCFNEAISIDIEELLKQNNSENNLDDSLIF